jgi:hypothetical protein
VDLYEDTDVLEEYTFMFRAEDEITCSFRSLLSTYKSTSHYPEDPRSTISSP